MKGRYPWAAAAGLTVVVVAAQAAPGSAGIYTSTQAEAGAHVYAERCALCHGKTGTGTWEVPPLTGRFVANWGKNSMAALSEYIGRAMPQYAPGSLTTKERTELLAYLLQLNGQPAGPNPLPADAAPLAAMPVGAVMKSGSH